MLKPYAKYKETPALWLNSIPDHWESHKIRELFVERSEKVSDKDYSPLSVSKAGVVPQIATVAKTNNGDNRKLVRKGDFVINSRSDRRGSSGISNYDGSVSLINIVLKPRSFVNGRYMHYLLKSHYFIEEFYRNGRGIVADLWTTRYTEMKSIYLPVPSIEEQDQIVRFLDWKLAKINKLIRAKKKQIALLNEQKQVIINNALTKGLDSHAKLKESGISGLGSIPSSWSVKPLKYWAKSNLQSLNSSTEADFEFDYLDISSVGFGYVKQEPVHYRFDEAPSRARRIVKYGDTIISTVRTYLRSMCFIDHDIEHCIVSTGFSVLSPIKETVLPEILSYALSSDYFVNEVIKNSIGVSYPAINDKKLLSLKVALPSTIEEQLQLYNEIKSKTTLLDKGILSIKQQVTRLEEYRTRLISDVVTGKVDVRDIEIPEYEADSDETIDDEIDDNLVLDEEDGEMEVE
ncbi:restriction endonuclease subunit S [Eubacterium callanderi]|jgi:type I restriction enzyme S subunit|uniref:restriction endonuclease subunit S n=1 Tax=Eubacterium callanderi TaxID=53442 RepID=UPI001C1119F0|nr:restriction endonuclease subunit S [Eubacterium callanderi]MBU5304643.1 restriction endonuclease subunit S [Eubacterium callanderi]